MATYLKGHKMIAIDATPLQSEHRFRGVGAYTRHLCQALLKEIPGELEFYATNNGADLLPPDIRKRAYLGYRGHRPAQVYWLYNELYLRIMLGKTKPRVFHATDFNGTVKVPGIPTVATLHDLTNVHADKERTGPSARLSAWRWRMYYQKKLPQVDHVITVSQHVKDDAVQTLSIPPSRVSVIPLGIDTSQFYPARGKGPFAGRPPYILYVGSRDPNKNLDGVLRSFAFVAAELPDIRLGIAGRWNSEDVQWLKHRVDEDPATRGRVDHLGFVPDEDMASLYGNAELFLFPSLAEGFGFPVVEAMACHTPVVASNRPPISEVAGDGALLVNPLACEEMAQAMLSILSSSDQRNSLIVRGQRRIALYDWGRVGKDTIDVYRRFS